MKKLVMEDSRVPESCCPSCFKKMDHATNVFNSGPPSPGDWTICIVCAAVLRFDKNFQLEPSSLSEVPIAHRAEVAHVKRQIEQARYDWNKKGGRPWGVR